MEKLTEGFNYYDKRILVVDDALTIRKLLQKFLQAHAYKYVDIAKNGAEAKEMFDKAPYDLILSDYDMPVLNGSELLKYVKKQNPETIVIMLSGQGDKEIIIKLMRLADNFVMKDDIDRLKGELLFVIDKAVQYTMTKKQNEMLLKELKLKDKMIQSELTMAREISNELRKTTPEIPGFKFGVKFVPSNTIGGDSYNIFKIDDECYGVMLTDISGHGIPAALLSMVFKVKADELVYKSKSTSEVVRMINTELLGIFPENKFACVFYCIINVRTGVINYCTSAQEKPIYIQSNGELVELDSDSFGYIGIMESDLIMLNDMDITLKPGEKIFIFTDGIPEAVNSDNEMFGIERFFSYVKRFRNYDVHDFVEAMYKAGKEYIGNREFDDDVSLLVIEKVNLN